MGRRHTIPPEVHSSDRSDQGLPQGGVELSLDELSKGLASGTLSRGKALRLMGAALVGGALASIPGVALAVVPPCPSGTSICGPGRFCCEEGFCCKGGGGKPQCCFAEA